jgi:chemotaxis-related protein WspD
MSEVLQVASGGPLTVDCWNRIGVGGDSSCSELSQFIHCRNCGVYSTAAAQRLDTNLSAEHLEQSTRDVAREGTVSIRKNSSIVVFRIGAEWLALPTAIVHEVIGPRPICALPHRRDGVVLGLANVRGRLLVCAALRQILQLENAAPRERKHPANGRILVTLQDGARTAYPVDAVIGVHRFAPTDLMAVSKTATVHVKAVLTWQSRSVSLLDEKLLSTTVNRSLASATAI